MNPPPAGKGKRDPQEILNRHKERAKGEIRKRSDQEGAMQGRPVQGRPGEQRPEPAQGQPMQRRPGQPERPMRGRPGQQGADRG